MKLKKKEDKSMATLSLLKGVLNTHGWKYRNKVLSRERRNDLPGTAPKWIYIPYTVTKPRHYCS